MSGMISGMQGQQPDDASAAAIAPPLAGRLPEQGQATFCQPQIVAGAVVVGEMVAAILALAPVAGADRWEAFGLGSLLIQWILMLSIAGTCLVQRRIPALRSHSLHAPEHAKSRGVLLLSTALAIFLLVTATSTLLVARYLLAGEIAEPREFMTRAIGIALAVATLAFLLFRGHVEGRQMATRLKQAEVDALHARIHPHFLFNTLNSATALIHARPDDAERILLDLSDLFRAALSKPGWVPLEHELELCKRYLEIEQQRFLDTLQVEWRIEPGTHELFVPLLTVQPLVENAVVHGRDASNGRKLVTIAVDVTPTNLAISISNPVSDGVQDAIAGGHRVGLAAVRARVDAATHGQGKVTAERAGTKFLAHVLLPLESMPKPQTTTS
jgi:two-component system, LytTR family, sensor histidine kinase AlgZ